MHLLGVGLALTLLAVIAPARASASITVNVAGNSHFDTENTVVWIGTATYLGAQNQYVCASSGGTEISFLINSGTAITDNVFIYTGTGSDTHYFVQSGFTPGASQDCGLTNWAGLGFSTYFAWSQSNSGSNSWYGPSGSPSYFLVGSSGVDSMNGYASTGSFSSSGGNDFVTSWFSTASSESYNTASGDDNLCDESGSWNAASATCGTGSDWDNQTAGAPINADCDTHGDTSC